MPVDQLILGLAAAGLYLSVLMTIQTVAIVYAVFSAGTAMRHLERSPSERAQFLAIWQRARKMRAELLDHAYWMSTDEDEPLTPDELARVRQGETEIARGNYITLAELDAGQARIVGDPTDAVRYRLGTGQESGGTASEIARAVVGALGSRGQRSG